MSAAVTTDPNDQAYQIREQLATLEAALLAKDPSMPQHLRTIHAQLKKDPDLVTLLTEEECNILVEGLKKQTGVSIAVAAIKSAPKKAMSKMTLSDL
mgnify:CR=1 FL=1